MMSTGQKIKYYRKRHNMSQFDLEIEIDASSGSISRIENGHINPTKETLKKISNALKLSASEKANIYDIDIPINIKKDIYIKISFTNNPISKTK